MRVFGPKMVYGVWTWNKIHSAPPANGAVSPGSLGGISRVTSTIWTILFRHHFPVRRESERRESDRPVPETGGSMNNGEREPKTVSPNLPKKERGGEGIGTGTKWR
eukprot:Gb_31171 [translate_table: standard]